MKISRTLVVAPHPDDEILGCGGTLLRRRFEGTEIGWLIVTGMSTDAGWSSEQVLQREAEIGRVAEMMGFAQVFNLRLPTAQLDRLPMGDIVSRFAGVFTEFLPEEVFLPHPEDVHSDHRVVFDAAAACSKWFRYPSVRRVVAYETPSETDFGLAPCGAFRPNCFVDVSEYLDRKVEIMETYKSEIGSFPFPRSVEAVRALAKTRGATGGFHAAEAFQILRERF